MLTIKGMKELFGVEKPILGMVHLLPLPGAPLYGGDLKPVLDRALQDAHTLESGGVDALIIENFHDSPFFRETQEPETVSALTIMAYEVSKAVSIPIGLNVLRNSWKAAIAIAHMVGGIFIRLNILTDVMITDQGPVIGSAAEATRYRKFIGAENVRIFSDIESKHAVPVARRPLGVVARDMAYRAMADAIIISGEESSDPAKLEDIEEVRNSVPDTPLILGSGMTPTHAEMVKYVDGAVFGYGAKRDGDMTNPIDPDLVAEFMKGVRKVR
jgi:membrane complex biogenesis BtpA family protein